MTYRQLFDEALGAPPPSSVDIDDLLTRERRRGRLRRGGMYASVATGLLALTLGAGVATGIGPASDPGPMTAASSGTQLDHQKHLRTAMLAAIEREAPDLRWVKGAKPPTNERKWDGPVTDTPNWSVEKYAWVSMDGWQGSGVAARGGVRSYLGINVGRPKKGEPSGPYDCSGHSRACQTSTGPNGDKVVAIDGDAWKKDPSSPTGSRPITDRHVTVHRTDGTRVSVQIFSNDGHLLSVEQMIGIALDRAIALPGR
ncbi:hypothetical protein OG559_10795 [Micromonospora sp. NBC_01405]|uniref:hypothetical protein n=1 Tax=Micromonospora sp. NBC_01405 TaxID=2903589 RepID=UPI00324EBF93